MSSFDIKSEIKKQDIGAVTGCIICDIDATLDTGVVVCSRCNADIKESHSTLIREETRPTEKGTCCLVCHVKNLNELHMPICIVCSHQRTLQTQTIAQRACLSCKDSKTTCIECNIPLGLTCHHSDHMEWNHGWTCCAMPDDDGGRCGTVFKPDNDRESNCTIHRTNFS